eukprot:TRINITY_DN668_c0_g1_i1.p1 TRINITY_DN668_c0_g1~~TRINITY_DN668_c0_g1_i1.p1  ORF type:complete len:1068 (+),score=319.10 TRINITY_DN668_c0_g1_i1:260-3463(+)
MYSASRGGVVSGDISTSTGRLRSASVASGSEVSGRRVLTTNVQVFRQKKPTEQQQLKQEHPAGWTPTTQTLPPAIPTASPIHTPVKTASKSEKEPPVFNVDKHHHPSSISSSITSSPTENASSSVIMSPDATNDNQERNQKLKKKVLEEICSSEESYLNQLRTLIKDYKEPIERSGVIDTATVKVIFSNVVVLEGLHTNFYNQLKQEISTTGGAGIVKIMLGLIPQLMIYIEYVNSYDSAELTINKLNKKNHKFSSLIDCLGSGNYIGSMGFQSLRSSPIQRPPRYLLLIKQLKNYTPEDSPDSETLSKLYSDAAKLVETINEKKRRDEAVRRLQQLSEQISESKNLERLLDSPYPSNEQEQFYDKFRQENCVTIDPASVSSSNYNPGSLNHESSMSDLDADSNGKKRQMNPVGSFIGGLTHKRPSSSRKSSLTNSSSTYTLDGGASALLRSSSLFDPSSSSEYETSKSSNKRPTLIKHNRFLINEFFDLEHKFCPLSNISSSTKYTPCILIFFNDSLCVVYPEEGRTPSEYQTNIYNNSSATPTILSGSDSYKKLEFVSLIKWRTKSGGNQSAVLNDAVSAQEEDNVFSITDPKYNELHTFKAKSKSEKDETVAQIYKQMKRWLEKSVVETEIRTETKRYLEGIKIKILYTVPIHSATEKQFTGYVLEMTRPVEATDSNSNANSNSNSNDAEAKNDASQTVTILKRYRQFLELHEELKKVYKKDLTAKFPKKRYLKNNTEAKFVQKRCKKLERYLNEVVALPGVLNLIFVQQFLTTTLGSKGETTESLVRKQIIKLHQEKKEKEKKEREKELEASERESQRESKRNRVKSVFQDSDSSDEERYGNGFSTWKGIKTSGRSRVIVKTSGGGGSKIETRRRSKSGGERREMGRMVVGEVKERLEEMEKEKRSSYEDEGSVLVKPSDLYLTGSSTIRRRKDKGDNDDNNKEEEKEKERKERDREEEKERERKRREERRKRREDKDHVRREGDDVRKYYTLSRRKEKRRGSEGGERYVALWDYVSERPTELGMLAGDEVEVIEKSEDGVWWYGTINHRDFGWFPSSYVKVN